MAKHRHGSMEISEQRKTFAGFMRVAGLAIVAVVVILLLLTFRI
jgi:hypothetical protein